MKNKELVETFGELGVEELRRYKVTEDTDEKTGQRRMRIEGVCQRADAVNRNGRLYPRDVLESARLRLDVKIAAGRGFGEVDHPDFRPKLGHTSHIVNKAWWDETDKNLMCCDVTILDTPRGQILKEIVRAGGRPGFSSRGTGEAERTKLGDKDVDRIKDGYDLQSFDFVLDPSVEESSIRKILESAAEKIKEEDERMKNVAELRQAFPELVKEIEEKILEDAVAVHDKDTVTLDEKIKALEAKVADLEKTVSERLAENTKISQELTSKDEDLGRYSSFMSGLADLLEAGGWWDKLKKKKADQKAADGEAKPGDEKKKKEGTEAVLTATIISLEESVTKLESEKKALVEQLGASNTEKSVLVEKVSATEVKDFIEEQLKGSPHRSLLQPKLEGCKTIAEVKERLALLTSTVQSLEENFGGKGPKPKGQQESSDEDDDDRKIREDAKRRAGIHQEVKK